MLSDKMRIRINYSEFALFSNRQVSFYRRYASFVASALNKPIFQRFLGWLLKREKIDKNVFQDIQIRVFPSQKENGNSLAGKWNNDGKILIFPRTAEFYKDLVERYGGKMALSYLKGRAWATLIHEILHSKYLSDEEKVRQLTERYFGIYAKNPKTENLEDVVFETLFKRQSAIQS